MNSKFKSFPLRTENIFEKLKSLLKFSIILFAIFVLPSQKVEAQKAPPKEVQKGPIQFTNQYYKYSVVKDTVELAGLTIDVKNLEKTILDLEMDKDKESEADTCYQKITENYEFRICNPLKNELTVPAQVLINDEPADSAGSVILQDLRKFIKLNIKLNNFSVIEFKARRRSIAPYKVYKVKEENQTKFTFIDLNNRKNIWEKTLGTDVLTFRLESVTEDSYSIFQDYIYISGQPEKEEFDFTFKLPTEIQYAYNRFGINGLIGFSSFTTSTSTYTSTLNSSVGLGLKVLYERNLDRTKTVYTNITMYSAQITDERKSVVLINKNFNLIDFNLGYKKYYDLNWSLNYELNFRNHFTSQETSTNSGQYEILQSYTGSVGATPEYTLLETRQFNFVADASAGLILPQSTTYGQTQIGYMWGLGLKTTYKLRSSRLYAGINYDDRTFKTSDASFGNKDFIYSLGYYYLY